MKIHYETDRFILRDFEAQDSIGIFALDSDPLVHKYLGNNPLTHISQAEDVIAMIQAQYEKNGIGRWAVIEKETGEFMGWSGLKYEENLRSEFNYYDLGFRFKPKFWGKGLATETALLSLIHGFEVMGLDTICAAADVENLASNVVIKKVGLQFKELFYYEGIPVNWFEIKRVNWSSENVVANHKE